MLGPTNTGKTHLAVERMLGHRSGMIGLPLRLLAREIYDRVVAAKGRTSVALITGEERIMPARPSYFVCTVESMPQDAIVAFLAVDEIQLCADPERGHVFTDRLLRARGTDETMFMGADTMRPIIRHLLPDAEFINRPRFSHLEHTGYRKLSRLPRRSAIVAFSVAEIYAAAELVRRQRGGAAVVMGALSPRTRNAQVALYENGDVDFIVATDAIGMGLNMNVDHVAFLGLRKFDGRSVRDLRPAELAQIAGRAGRYMNDGTFGTAGDIGAIDPSVAEQIMEHRFPAVETLHWRNTDLSYGSVDALTHSLHESPPAACLRRTGENEDLYVLRSLARDPSVTDRAKGPAAVKLLWEVCRIPDFRKTMPDVHARLLGEIFTHLISGDGVLPADWFARHVERLDRTEGDIDTLQNRLAHVRTWNYVSNRPGWLLEPDHWQARVAEIEQKLSDALHNNLTQRFVDRRGSLLARRSSNGDDLLAAVDKEGRVLVEGEFVGDLDGFTFRPDPSAEGSEQKTLRNAALRILPGEIEARAEKLSRTPDDGFALSEDPAGSGSLIAWRGHTIAKTVPGASPLSPGISMLSSELLTGPAREKVEIRVRRWFEDRLKQHLAPLLRLKEHADSDPDFDGGARGVAFQLIERLGTVPRRVVAAQMKSLSRNGRKALRHYGVRFGEHAIYMPALFKAAPARLRFDLWKLGRDDQTRLTAPDPALMSVATDKSFSPDYYAAAGLTICGQRAVRIDILDRLARMLRTRSRNGPFPSDPALMSLVGCGSEAFEDVLGALGFETKQIEEKACIARIVRKRRVKAKPRKPSVRTKSDKPKDAATGKDTKPAKVSRIRSQRPQPVDADSPFAVLQELKAKMNKPAKPRRRKAKSA